MGDSGVITRARVYMSMVTTVMVVAIVGRREGAATNKIHMATVTWRAGRLAAWFAWKWLAFCI